MRAGLRGREELVTGPEEMVRMQPPTEDRVSGRGLETLP